MCIVISHVAKKGGYGQRKVVSNLIVESEPTVVDGEVKTVIANGSYEKKGYWKFGN